MEIAASLPAAPRIFAELGRKLRDPQCPLDEVAELVKRDASLAARLLRVSNSVAFRGEQPTASVEEAVARLGYREIFQLVGLLAGGQLADAALKSYGIEAVELRAHVLKTAIVSEQLAKECGLDERAAYTAGLMRAVGLFVCDRLAQAQVPAAVWHPVHDGDYLAWEARIFGLGNPEVAAMILGEWRFPDEVVAGIREHYCAPDRKDPPPLACLLNIASTLVADDRGGLPGEIHHWGATPDKLARLGLSARQVAAARDQAAKLFSQRQSLVNELHATEAPPTASAHRTVADIQPQLARYRSMEPALPKKNCDSEPSSRVVEKNDDQPVHTTDALPQVAAPLDFTTFMRNYQDMVYSTAVRLIGNETQAEDIAQEVFIKAHEHWEKLAGSPTAGGWLKTVATNMSINHIQRYKKRWSFFSDLVHRSDEGEEKEVEFAAPDTFFHGVDSAERREYIEHALEKLPDHQRVPLILFHFEDMPYEDIAKKLGVSLSKVKTDILRAREALAKILVRRGTAHETFQP
jgi:RNA polymerase sigma-70 factor, ECF subfamily